MQSKLEIDLKENLHYNTINNVFEKLGIGKVWEYMGILLILIGLFMFIMSVIKFRKTYLTVTNKK